MPNTTQNQLEALQAEVREAIVHSTNEALALLAEALPAGRPKHNQVLVLTSRAADIANHDINNTLAPHLLDVLHNELRRDVLTFTDHLTLTDFGPGAPPRPELKPGHLLYKVPPKMAVRETYECLIRIAHQLSHVMAGVELDDSVSFEELPVAEVMEVEVLDASQEGNPAFDILLLSDGEQLVDEFSATDWVFNIRPLREGEHRLVLKISVLITVGGKERTKNIVLQRPISVTAELANEALGELIRVSGLETPSSGPADIIVREPPAPAPPAFETHTEPSAAEEAAAETEVPQSPKSSPYETGGSGSTPPVPPPPTPQSPAPAKTARKRNGRIRYLSIAASILLMVCFAWWVIPGEQVYPIDELPGVKPPHAGPDSADTGEKVDSVGRDSLRF